VNLAGIGPSKTLSGDKKASQLSLESSRAPTAAGICIHKLAKSTSAMPLIQKTVNARQKKKMLASCFTFNKDGSSTASL
jgi:hypothetical protein